MSYLNIFSESENYAIEMIPKNMSFFKKKKFIKDKLNQINHENINHEKAMVFVEKSKIMWAFLKNEEKYWLPMEKVHFYLSMFEETGNSILIIEEHLSGKLYYGLVDNFLVVYTKNYNEAIENINKYNYGQKITILGVGNITEKCHKTINCAQIAAKIGIKETRKEIIHDDLIYLNEENDEYNSSPQKNVDELFHYWFDNVKNKVNFKKRAVLFFLIFGMCFFFSIDVYCLCKESALKSEIAITIEKLNKLSKKLSL